MKKIFFRLLKSKAFQRAKNIKSIGLEKRNRIAEAINYLYEWEDIPMRELFKPVCEILKITPNDEARRLIFDLCIPNVNIESIKKRL